MGRCCACDAGIDSWDSAQRGGYPDTSNFSACSGFSEAEPGSRPTLEASALTHAGVAGHARSPLLRLQSDERLITLIRRGNHHAFEALVARYQARLLAFCRHMLSSREDAEDVLQEVFAAAFNAIVADERAINVRPWLYRIARNRSLNHLRKAQAIGVDSMDVHLSEHGLTTADKVHRREEFRQLMADVQELPETQRTALLLREIDALSYEQIAEAMETTVPSVKSLLVRARVSLAEAGEARLLTCDDVRAELGEVAEGLRRTSAPVRRHLRGCERCAGFRKQLRQTNRALAAVFPVAPLLLLKKTFLAHAGTTAAAGGGTAAAGSGAAAAGSMAGGAAIQAGLSTIATKAAAGLAAAAIVTAGAVEVRHVASAPAVSPPVPAVAAVPKAPAAPVETVAIAEPHAAHLVAAPPEVKPEPRVEEKPAAPAAAAAVAVAASATPEPAAEPVVEAAAAPVETVEQGGDTTVLDVETTASAAPAGGALAPQPVAAPAPVTAAPAPVEPAPVAPAPAAPAPAEPAPAPAEPAQEPAPAAEQPGA